jgi:hypothetical protein
VILSSLSNLGGKQIPLPTELTVLLSGRGILDIGNIIFHAVRYSLRTHGTFGGSKIFDIQVC